MALEFDDTDLYDYLDIDCQDCGVKFIVGPLSNEAKAMGKEYPSKCSRCRQGLPPLYEY